jgi:hypothetical protein
LRCALSAVVLTGCPHSPQSAAVPAPSSAPSSERPAVGAFLDPEPARPSPVARADARGVVSLREPVGERDIARFVQGFLDAWRRESLEDLDSLLSQSSDTGPIEALGRGREAVIENWKDRLKAHAHEYARLGGDLVAPERIEHRDSDEVGSFEGPWPRATLRVGDVYVSAPLRVTSSGSDRLFGNFLVMVLRREKGELRMVAYGETDDSPWH